MISNKLQPGHSNFIKNIYYAYYLNNFSGVTGQGRIPFMALIYKILLEAHDAQLEAYHCGHRRPWLSGCSFIAFCREFNDNFG